MPGFWIVGHTIGTLAGAVAWSLGGSALGAFFAGANAVFLLWAVQDHLDAKLKRLNDELAADLILRRS